MVLIERIALNRAGGAAGCGVGRCAARCALGSKMQAADDPHHSRNVDDTKYEPKENRKAESQLDRRCAAFAGAETKVTFQSIEAFLARCSSKFGSMQGLNRQRLAYMSSSPAP